MSVPPCRQLPLNTQEVRTLLKARGIRITAQRVSIAKVLFAQLQHLSAADLLQGVHQGDFKHVSRATVYNTLNLFVSRGLVNEVHVGSRCVFYDNNMEPHHHIYDEDTGVLCDLNLSKVQCVVDPDSLPSGTVQVGTDVTIRVRRKHSP